MPSLAGMAWFGPGSGRITLPSVAGGALDFGRSWAKTVSGAVRRCGSGPVRAITLPSVAGGALDSGRAGAVKVPGNESKGHCRALAALDLAIRACVRTAMTKLGPGFSRITLTFRGWGALDIGWAGALLYHENKKGGAHG
jgi:hypothetical protein